MKVSIGKTEEGKLSLDVMALLAQRLLVTANSGGGKSVLLRKIMEATWGQVPHIVLDPDGEFSDLRPSFDYLLIGKNGDIPASPFTAAELARTLLQTNASAIIDLFELKRIERHQFMDAFLRALVEAPKNLWGPRLVFLDESHEFCPEKGTGASQASEAVIDICERGRKRGLGVVLATQRLSKLSKDAAAECGNKLIGVCNMDIDRQRAAGELGFNTKESVLSLRDLDPGVFYAVGRALSKNVVKATIDLPKTYSTRKGRPMTGKAPAPTAKVRGMLEKFKNLPKVAQETARTIEGLSAQVAELKKQLAASPYKNLADVDIENLKRRHEVELKKITLEMDRRRFNDFETALAEMKAGLLGVLEKVAKKYGKDPGGFTPRLVPTTVSPALFSKPERIKELEKERAFEASKAKAADLADRPLGKMEREILAFLRGRGRGYTKEVVAQGSGDGKAWNGGSFRNAIGRLRTLGYVEDLGDLIRISASAPEGEGPGLPVLDAVMKNQGKMEREMFETLKSHPGHAFEPMELAANMPSNPAFSGGSFRNALGRLRTLGIVTDRGLIRIREEVANW